MKIEHVTNPTSADIDFLTEQINNETPQFGSAYGFAVFIRNDKGKIIAGANGSIVFGAIYTDQLWVSKNYRKTGLGKKLMEAIHKYGKDNCCTFATVNTMSFQEARIFYEKLGYVVDFERNGYAKGASMLFMKKEI